MFWASSLFLESVDGTNFFLLVLPPIQDMLICSLMHKLANIPLGRNVPTAPLKWEALGDFSVKITADGFYMLNEASPGLWVGAHLITNPGMWISNMIRINGQDAVVDALRGRYLSGTPWEDAETLLEEIRDEVLVLLDDPLTNRKRILQHLRRFQEADFHTLPEVVDFDEFVRDRLPTG